MIVKRFQVPIVGAVLLVAVCAMAFAGLRTASDLWRSGLYTLVVGLLLFAVLAARFRRGKEGAFWFGFAVFGWGCFLLGYRTPTPHFIDRGASMPSSNLNPSMLSTRVVLFLVPHLRPRVEALGPGFDQATANAIVIALLLVTLLAAVAGGALAAFMKGRPGDKTSIKSLTVLVGLLFAGSIAASCDRADPFGPFSPAPGDAAAPSVLRPQLHQIVANRPLAARFGPSLRDASSRGTNAEIYRLLWLPSFHHPLSVRIDRTGNHAWLHVTILDGSEYACGSSPVIAAQDADISIKQWKALERRLQNAAFWSMPTKEELGGMACEGDVLVLEGVRAGRYQCVVRTMPGPVFEELCGYMLSLTNIKTGEAWNDYHSSRGMH